MAEIIESGIWIKPVQVKNNFKLWAYELGDLILNR